MTKKKRSGRVTPKGTPPAGSKKAKGPRPDPQEAIGRTVHLPGKLNRPKGRAARPVTHNRGNR